MAGRYFELHKQHFPDEQSYQSLQGLLNYDQMCWSWALHPQILELTCRYLGQNMRFAEACSKRVIWGCLRFPSDMWLFQTMWFPFVTTTGGIPLILSSIDC